MEQLYGAKGGAPPESGRGIQVQPGKEMHRPSGLDDSISWIMRRLVLLLLLVLLLGATINLVVAWICAWRGFFSCGAGKQTSDMAVVVREAAAGVSALESKDQEWLRANNFQVRGKQQMETVTIATFGHERCEFCLWHGGSTGSFVVDRIEAGWPMRSFVGDEWLAGQYGDVQNSWTESNVSVFSVFGMRLALSIRPSITPAMIVNSASIPYAKSSMLVLPIRPLWPGFIANTIAYAALALVMLRGMRWSRLAYRRWRGNCLCCGYSLIGNASGQCPECGTATRSAAQESGASGGIASSTELQAHGPAQTRRDTPSPSAGN